MAQFDVHQNPFGTGSPEIPYVLELQHDLFDSVDFALLAPLIPRRLVARPISVLNPVVRLFGEEHVLLTQQVVSVRRRVLKQAAANIAAERYTILRALDMLFTGF